MDKKAADPKWMDRLVQTREQTTAQYLAWCSEMANAFMEFAVKFEELGEEEQAKRAQCIAKTMKAEVEKILEHG